MDGSLCCVRELNGIANTSVVYELYNKNSANWLLFSSAIAVPRLILVANLPSGCWYCFLICTSLFTSILGQLTQPV